MSSNPSTLSTLEVPVTIMFDNSQFDSLALIDSGAAGNFIDFNFAKTHSLPLVSCESGVAVAALDGRPLGTGHVKFITKDITLRTGSLHTESIRLFAIESPRNPKSSACPGWRNTIPAYHGPHDRSFSGLRHVTSTAFCSILTHLYHLNLFSKKVQLFRDYQLNTMIWVKPSVSPKPHNFPLIALAMVPSISFLGQYPPEAEFFH